MARIQYWLTCMIGGECRHTNDIVMHMMVDNYVVHVRSNDLVATDVGDIGFAARMCDCVKAGHATVVSIVKSAWRGGYVRAILPRAVCFNNFSGRAALFNQ